VTKRKVPRRVFLSRSRRHYGPFCYHPAVDNFVEGFRLCGCAGVVWRRVTRLAASGEPAFLFENLFRDGPYGMPTTSRKRRVLEAHARACALLCYERDQPVGQGFKNMADPPDERWGVAPFYDMMSLNRPDSIPSYLGPAVGRMPGSGPDELAWVPAFDHILPGNHGGGVREARAAVGCRRSLPPRHWHKVCSWIHPEKVTC
jgi:hypothetical protein